MTSISIDEAREALPELVRLAEAGETVVLTRDGRPVLDLVPRRHEGGLDLEAGRKYMRDRGIGRMFGPVPDDFDDPLPEDFLITPERE